MKSIRSNYIWHTVIATVTLIGWFVLSNHCALGLMQQTAQAKTEHACCHEGDSKPEKQPGQKEGTQCCKSLHVVIPDGVKDLSLTSATFVFGTSALLLDPEAYAVEAKLAVIDTGPPPRAESFSELVLHRSLRSHAPPLVA